MHIENSPEFADVARALGVTITTGLDGARAVLMVDTPSGMSARVPYTDSGHATEMLRYAASEAHPAMLRGGVDHLRAIPVPTREGRPEVYDASFLAALALMAAVKAEAAREAATMAPEGA